MTDPLARLALGSLASQGAFYLQFYYIRTGGGRVNTDTDGSIPKPKGTNKIVNKEVMPPALCHLNVLLLM
jgi:hypothetical protein